MGGLPAPLSLKTLFGELPEELASIQPDAQYQLLDELHYSGPPAPWHNLMAILMELERAPSDEALIAQLVRALLPVLRHHGSQQLQNAFEQFINHSVRTAPEQPLRLDDLKEDITMLRENAAQWRKQWVQQGRIEGKLEGKLEGERLLLTRQLTRRYGELPGWTVERLQQAEQGELERIGDQLLDALSLDQLFGR